MASPPFALADDEYDFDRAPSKKSKRIRADHDKRSLAGPHAHEQGTRMVVDNVRE